MNSTIRQKFFCGLTFFISMLFTLAGYAQGGTSILMTMQNVVQTAPNTFEYDVMLTNTGTTSLSIRGYSCGINHASGMNGGGTLTQSFISRDAALSTIPAVSASYTAATNHMRFTTLNAAAGSEVAISAGVPIRLATVRVTNTVNFPSNFNPAFTLQLLSASGKTPCLATCIVTHHRVPAMPSIVQGIPLQPVLYNCFQVRS
ncbi:hypothetical protein EMGBS15_04370 [Filimonas sp.]|nr:hypothetical protein EMGBS15_04370 [Filimonas sp.]